MTAEASCVLSVPQIIDVALNTPEVGSVNFRVLHALLHVLVQQIELTDCKVEFRGETGEKLQSLVANTKPGASITLTEYVVTPGKDVGKVVQRRHKYKAKEKRASTASEKKARSKEEVLKEKEIRLIERRKDSKEDPTPNPPPMELHPDVANKDSISSFDTIVVIEPAEEGVSTPHISVAVPKSLFDGVQEDIKNLKDQVQELIDLPGNMGLLEAMRDSGIDKTSPVLDMFQILNLTKRVDGTEMGINKLASMIEDLAKERPAAQPDVGGAAAESGGASGERLTALEGRVQALEGALGGEGGAGGFGGADVAEMQNELNSIKEKIKGFESITEQFSADHIIEALKDLDELREKLLAKPGDSDHNMELPADIRLNELENRFNEYIEQFNSLDALFNNQINTIQSQLGDLEKEIGSLVERINTGLPAGDASGIADQSVGELYTKIMSLQAEMENMADTANKLLDDKDERQKFMDSMLEQIEVLKTVKADKEDLEDALADKADACAVNRKVSHERFDAACDDLSRGIEDALAKLTQQETLWQQALDDIQREIGTKLDKMELAPLRDFVNKKLKMLQEKLKALAAIKKDQEAAGTKAKLLRNVNCISCDKDVVMRTQVDPSLLPKPVALPPARSMGPYLAYELDALRKQQKCLPGSRNLNHFENAVMGSSKSPRDEDHVCNRYCGGSHTTTTPQQRVTRLGHFLNQWGQDSEPVQEGQIRGTDGQMYKSRDYDVSKDLSQIGDSQTEAGISRPSMLVHSAVVTERQHSTRSTGAEGEARKQSIDKTTARKASADRKQSIEKRKASNSKVTPEVPETPEVVPEETGSQTAPRGSNTSPPPPPPPDPSAATVQIQE